METRCARSRLVTSRHETALLEARPRRCHNQRLWHMAIYTNWWYTYPSEKYESQWEGLFPIYGTIKNVPNHQAVYMGYGCLKMGYTPNEIAI